jgi:hypothetical protein
MPKRSEKRQRNKQCKVRLTEKEFAQLAALAEKAEWSLAAIFRAAALGNPGPRAHRRVPADEAILRQVLGQCGRIGNNLNQIAKHLNKGQRASIPELDAALSAHIDIRNAILKALDLPIGEGTSRDHQGQQPRRT